MENPNGAVQGNSQNVPEAQTPRTRSSFDLAYHFFDTHRFGEYHPHYVAEGEKNDILPIRSSHDVLSYTLKSPLMQNVSMKKDYFSVPMMAILPINWDKWYENPVRGDDVLSDVGPSVSQFWDKVGFFFNKAVSSLDTILADSTKTQAQKITAFFRFLVYGEYFYSNGNLLSSLHCHGAPYIDVTDVDGVKISYDKFFDSIIQDFIALADSPDYFTMTVDGYTYVVGEDNKPFQSGIISLRHALSLMRDNLTFMIQNVSWPGDITGNLRIALQDYTFNPVRSTAPLRLARLWAYQLVCAHYYTNDHIDFIYSSELFRSLISFYVRDAEGPQNFATQQFFTFNGVAYQYDALSAHAFARIIDLAGVYSSDILYQSPSGAARYAAINGYFSALFAFRRSLRYLDYFTGSRAQPLAVGNTGVAVVNNSVDVINITRGIQSQRFWNAVNRIRHTTEGYLKGLFGGDTPAPDYHNPFFLAHTDDVVFGQDTENTADAQMSEKIAVTSRFRSNGSRYMFEMHCDRPCELIGITYYDIPRVYTKNTERSYFWLDRFDMFNPFMQYIGDQPIYLNELGIGSGNDLVPLSNFAYTLRHMEYKQRYNQCAGGFVENLPGFAFLAMDERGNQRTINPDWIRSVNSEFDNFFVSLTGWSLGSYFHFIVDNYNDCTGSRPMAYAPSIL